MIDRALTLITREINQFLRIRFDLNEDKILLAPLVNQDGTIAIQDENKIILTLTDVSQESAIKNGSWHKIGSEGIERQRPDLHLNLYVLFSAYFNPLNYSEALKYLSAIISFFHAKPMFNPSNSPQFSGTGIDKLVFDIFHQDSNSKNNLWSTMGAKYMPSISYKMRMLTLSDNSLYQQIDSISGVDLDKEITD